MVGHVNLNLGRKDKDQNLLLYHNKILARVEICVVRGDRNDQEIILFLDYDSRVTLIHSSLMQLLLIRKQG